MCALGHLTLDVSGLSVAKGLKMADMADNSSGKDQGKRGKRGPYNQYLSQPGLKIP